MKKSFLSVIVISALFTAGLFAQSEDFEDMSTESFEEMDDFDSIFSDAEDLEEAVTDEPAQGNGVVQVFSSAFSSMVHFSGSFSGSLGVTYNYDGRIENEDDRDSYAFGIKLNNSLNMTINPGAALVIRGGLDTGIDNGFNLGVSYLYFDYLLFDRIYISAGKRGVSWGYLRLFTDGHNNIFSEDGTQLAMEIRYPWTFGTLTFAVTGNASNVKPNSLNYYGSLEVTVLNTSINLFAKRPEKLSEPKKSNAFGLELKRTILGFDVYGQELLRLSNIRAFDSPKNYDYIIETVGFYRLFDSFDPNIGFNIEYKHEYEPKAEKEHSDYISFEGGLKRLGKNKNIKIGVTSKFNITEKNGSSTLGLAVSGLLPYADWANSFGISYGKGYNAAVFSISTGLSLSLDY